MKNKAIAVVGMCGTGKSVVTEILKEHGFQNIYFGDVVLNKVRAMGLPLTQANERPVREQLRKDYGMAAIAVEVYPEIEKTLEKGNVSLESLYSWSEYKYIKERLGDQFMVLAIVSNAKDRYERLTTRTIRPLTEEEAKGRDYAEIENSEKGGPIAIADYYIYNSGKEEDLKQKVEEFLQTI
ncbi:MAG: AAA family ATPase [Bacilli bacterium]|nr:AAA family ATPase [Bacilli bacterium]